MVLVFTDRLDFCWDLSFVAVYWLHNKGVCILIYNWLFYHQYYVVRMVEDLLAGRAWAVRGEILQHFKVSLFGYSNLADKTTPKESIFEFMRTTNEFYSG